MRKLLLLVLAALMIVALLPVAVMAAGGTFTDDDTSMFEADIEWLAATGVTRGCNPPANDHFCPDSNVTRGQMAAFMRRFAGFLDAEDGQVASADNCDTVGGLAPGDLVRINGTMSDTPIDDFTETSWTAVQTMQIETPVDGMLHISTSVGLEDDYSLSGASWTYLRLTVDGVATHSNQWGYSVELSSDSGVKPSATIASLSAAVVVGSGQHTIALEALELGFGVDIFNRDVSAIFSPFGGGI